MQCTYLDGKYCFGKEKRVSKKKIEGYCNSNYKECPYYVSFFGDDLIVTILVKLNIDLQTRINIINTFNNSRIEVLETSNEYRDFLMLYDRVNPLIVDVIWNNPRDIVDKILTDVYAKFIVPINEKVNNNEFEQAYYLFEKMLEELVIKFHLGREYCYIKHDIKHPEEIKRRRKRI